MLYDHIIKADTQEAAWEKLKNDLLSNPDVLEYKTIIEQGGRRIYLSVDIDPGGGFEGGFELTTIYSPIATTARRFAIHHENFFDEIGKFFGMQDIVTGYADFDRKVAVKGEDEHFVKQIFGDETVRAAFEDLHAFSFGIRDHRFGNENEVGTLLEFEIEEAITEPDSLFTIYNAFMQVLQQYEPAMVMA